MNARRHSRADDPRAGKCVGGGAKNAAKQRCPQGHPYDPSNTYAHRDRLGRVHRDCRACMLARTKKYQTAKRRRPAEPGDTQ